ncbi:hypothetical protein D9757_001087 [Collybiopsis confluens]|uniref:Uncharacterized protein n=1 Tax=Collybiopsis confluens TaxID=2823264 RepID=A0A8H5MGD0_9AGAR|nr:hypothetical protein D9757_001087 [Collybiopsis confluens]
MLQFLLHHVWNDLPEEEFWKYLNNVLHHFDIVEADQRFHEDESCGISISSFIVKLCENWMSRPGYQPSALDHLLVEKVKTEWNTKLVRGPSDRAIILVRATEKLQVQFQTHSTTFAEFAVLAIDLPHVLRYGSVKAHCSFIDNNYLTLLYEHYKTQPQSHYIPDLVSNFVPALDSQDVKSPERAKCVDHLFEHQNSRYAIILVILELEDQMDWVDTPSILAQLCPLRQLLIDLRDWLKLVAKFLDATHKEDRECLREEIGMDPLLFSDQHSERLKDFIHSFDNYLADTQYQPEPLPLQEGTVVVRGRPQTAENSWIVSRSSALHW